MGWIYNGVEFIKANKAQRQAYDKYNHFQLGQTALAEPFALPTLAATVGVLAGTITIGSFAAVLWGPAKTIVDEAVQDLKDLPGEVKDAIIVAIDEAGVSVAEQPKFTQDALNCLRAHPKDTVIFGRKVPDLLRAPKILNCMRKKGWADDIVIQGIANIFN